LAAERLRHSVEALELERTRGPQERRDADPSRAAVAKATCVPDATTLCLGDGGRFQVETSFETFLGFGEGMAVPFRADTGLFWFFDSSNIELIVKVLDACAAPFDRFWVFAGGLTNVEVELRVTDTVTGEFRVYRNPSGQSYRPVLDTSAFDTCP
ncbi:MAG: hypothetical protein AAGM22_18795, partial [Acidobacteriota bacterium]